MQTGRRYTRDNKGHGHDKTRFVEKSAVPPRATERERNRQTDSRIIKKKNSRQSADNDRNFDHVRAFESPFLPRTNGIITLHGMMARMFT